MDDPTAPEPDGAGTDRQSGRHRRSGSYGQRCIRRVVPDPGRAETVTPASGAVAGAPARDRVGRPAAPRSGRGPRPAPSPAHLIRTPRQARPDGWRVDHVDTVPMTSAEYTSAVNALAALITAWAQKVHDSGDDEFQRAT